MEEKLITRLNTLGYEYHANTDEGLLTFCADSIENKIINRINTSTIPEELLEIEIDMICGEFLRVKKSMGQLTEYDFKQVVESIKEGDISVSLSKGTTPEQQFDLLLDSLINSHAEDFIRHRKLVW